MPFCNWCQMETAAGDVCAWCKRPLTARSVFGSFEHVREQDVSSPGERMAPLFGGFVVLAFLVVVGIALVKFPAADSAKPKSETVAEFGSPKEPIVTTSYTSSTTSTPATSTTGSKGRSFYSQGQVSGAASPPPSNLARASQAVASADGGGANANLTLSAGRFRISRTPDGRHILYGEADLEYIGNSPLRSCRFTLTIDDDPISMTVYSGDIYRPVYVIAPEIPVGKSTVFLINTEVSAKALNGGRRTLGIDGKNENGPLSSVIGLE